TPLEYLHRLNVAGLRAKLRVKSCPSDVRREHVEHFIETLADRDLADQLALLRISDDDALEQVLRARQLAKNRQREEPSGTCTLRIEHVSTEGRQFRRHEVGSNAQADRSQMVICAGSTWLPRKESRKTKRLRQMNPIGLHPAKLHHRETLAQTRDLHADTLSSNAALTAAHTAMTICTAGRG
ncbi:hypothetical protein L914_04503, partial [Phytophthora nicotianae]